MKVLILGATGQDGSILSEILAKKNENTVFCPVRSLEKSKEKDYLCRLFAKNNVKAFNFCYTENGIKKLVADLKVDTIVNFSAESNVFNPWSNITETMRVNAGIPSAILDSLIENKLNTKFIQASSSLVFGSGDVDFCNEETIRSPIFPYGIAKNTADLLIKQARQKHNINASSLIFFNHESERRSEHFLTKKVVLAARRISKGSKEKVILGNIDSYRDVGLAHDFMSVVSLIVSEKDNEDYVVGTGSLLCIRDIIKQIFLYHNLNYEDHIVVDSQLIRNHDTRYLKADIMKIKQRFSWIPKNFNVADIASEERES